MEKAEPSNPLDGLLTIAEAAEKLKVSYRQMFRFFESGELHPVRLTDRIVRVLQKDLDDFIGRKRG